MMPVAERLSWLNQAVLRHRGQPLSPIELAVIEGSDAGQTYEQIAAATNYSSSYLSRTFCPQLWQVLSVVLGKDVSKKNLHSILEQLPQTIAMAMSEPSIAPPSRSGKAKADWGEAIDVSVFYGRDYELSRLQEWSAQDRCRLMAILGMGGIGKTAISVKLAQQLQDQFEFVIWRSVRNAPSLETLLMELVPFLSNQQESKPELGKLVNCLRQSRCLVILDNLETLLDAERVGQFRSGFENYGELLRSLGEVGHQSCVVLTSREKPAEIATLEGMDLAVRSVRLDGSIEAARAILHSKGLVGTEDEHQGLGDRYGNSPLALKIVATSIQELFDGRIADFLQEDTFIFNGIRRLLDQHFQRLSSIETSILYWLAINREGTAIAELQMDLCPSISKANLLEALEKLARRSLIETLSGNRYTLQPVVMEYVTDCLIEQVRDELITANLNSTAPLFKTHALSKTTAKDFIRESQLRLILNPIAEQLRAAFPASETLKLHLDRVLETLHTSESQLPGYGTGNLINLCGNLQLSLVGADFSQLMVRYADCTRVNLQQSDFTGAILVHPTFAQTMSAVICVRLSPDGRFFATGDDTSQLQLWSMENGQPFLQLSGELGWIWSIAISPNSQTIAMPTRALMISLYRVSTGDCIACLTGHRDMIWSMQFSPDGNCLVSTSGDTTAKIWHLPTQQCLYTLAGHTKCIRALALSPNGQTIATGSDDRSIRLWDFATGDCLQELTGHTDAVFSVTFSPDGTILATSSGDCTIRLWRISTGECLNTIVAHTDWIWNLRFTPDGETLISASHDRLIKFWNVATGACWRTLTGHLNQIWSADLSVDGKTLITGSHDQSVKLWDVETGQCLKTVQGYSHQICTIGTSPNGNYLATAGSSDGVIRLWNLQQPQCIVKLSGHQGRIRSVAFNRNGEWLASSSEDFTVKIWDIKTTQCRLTLQGHENWVWTVVISPDDHWIASCSLDRTIKLWDSKTGQCLCTLVKPTYPVWSLAFSPDGRFLAMGGEELTTQVWAIEDLRSGIAQRLTAEQPFPEHPHWTLQHQSHGRYMVTFTPDSQQLATSRWGNQIELWDLSTGLLCETIATTIPIPAIHPVMFDATGHLLAYSLEDSSIQVWDRQRSQVFQTLVGHQQGILSFAFLPQTEDQPMLRLVSSGVDETIKIWNVETGDCLTTLYPDRLYEGMTITGISGLSAGQKAVLKKLGAVD
jgi:WD40 repeat protein